RGRQRSSRKRGRQRAGWWPWDECQLDGSVAGRIAGGRGGLRAQGVIHLDLGMVGEVAQGGIGAGDDLIAGLDAAQDLDMVNAGDAGGGGDELGGLRAGFDDEDALDRRLLVAA